MEVYVIATLLTLLLAITIAIARQRSLYSIVILSGAYSFLMASVLVALDAVDVAMTEAAVGAGVSTVFFLAALYLTKSREYPKPRNIIIPPFATLVTGAALVMGTWSLPPLGSPDAPIHQHTTPHYLEEAKAHRIAPNVVTAVLADYRSFDTLGETTVVFTAAIGVMLLLRQRRRRREDDEEDQKP